MPFMGSKSIVNKEKNSFPGGKSGAKAKIVKGKAAGGGGTNPSKKGGVFRAVKSN
jgi:hypothetical protein